MIVLTRDDPVLGLQTIAVFGSGLLGSALVGSLQARAAFERRALPVRWTDPDASVRQLSSVRDELLQALGRTRDATVQLVWATGRAGFDSTELEARQELESFRNVLQLARDVASATPGTRVSFVLLSSAGGLFEGQRNVGTSSEPAPQRRYGRLKLSQEELLRADTSGLIPKVYRLSSVYGYIRPRQRLGLIPTLIRNGLRHQETVILGTMHTLRDFIWVGDVSRFLAAVLLDEAEVSTPSTFVLAASKPSSLCEVHHRVEATLGRRIYVSYALGPTNTADITFAPSVLAPGWHTSDLPSNVARIYRDALGGGIAGLWSLPAGPARGGREAGPPDPRTP